MTIKMQKKFFESVTGKYDLDKLPYDIRVHLINISRLIGEKVRITSHVRTPEQNRLCGGSLTSSHLSGYAVDIVCTSSINRYQIINYCMPFFNRIGVYDKHIHLDWHPNKLQHVLWVDISN